MKRSPEVASSRASNIPTICGAQGPFLKWPGGKRWLCDDIEKHLPRRFNRYFEPFLGGAALFFHLSPRSAILSDLNEDLVNTYIQVRDRLPAVIRGLSLLRVNKSTYLTIRSQAPKGKLDRAIRFLYLNKTAFNGLYRVNRSGAFNVPFAGKQGRALFDGEELASASIRLKDCKIVAQDFSNAFRRARAGDLIYCDPPYTVRHNNNGFIRYNEALFSWDDQKRLASLAVEAVGRGVKVVVSNAQHASLRNLYGGFRAVVLTRTSCMAGDASRRGITSEYLFVGEPDRG